MRLFLMMCLIAASLNSLAHNPSDRQSKLIDMALGIQLGAHSCDTMSFMLFGDFRYHDMRANEANTLGHEYGRILLDWSENKFELSMLQYNAVNTFKGNLFEGKCTKK